MQSISADGVFFKTLDNACKGKCIPVHTAWLNKRLLPPDILSSDEIGRIIFKFNCMDPYMMPAIVAMIHKMIQHLNGIFITFLSDDNKGNSSNIDKFCNLIAELFLNVSQSSMKISSNSNHHKNDNGINNSFVNFFTQSKLLLDLIGQRSDQKKAQHFNDVNIFGSTNSKLIQYFADICRIDECIDNVKKPDNQSFDNLNSKLQHFGAFADLTAASKHCMKNEIGNYADINTSCITQASSSLNKYGIILNELIIWVNKQIVSILTDASYLNIFTNSIKIKLNCILNENANNQQDKVKIDNIHKNLMEYIEYVIDKSEDVDISCGNCISALDNFDVNHPLYARYRQLFNCLRFIFANRCVTEDDITDDAFVARFMLDTIIDYLQKTLGTIILDSKHGIPTPLRRGITTVRCIDTKNAFINGIIHGIASWLIVFHLGFVSNNSLSFDQTRYKQQQLFLTFLKTDIIDKVACLANISNQMQKDMIRQKKLPMDVILTAWNEKYTIVQIVKSHIDTDATLLPIAIDLIHFVKFRSACATIAGNMNVVTIERMEMALACTRTCLQSPFVVNTSTDAENILEAELMSMQATHDANRSFNISKGQINSHKQATRKPPAKRKKTSSNVKTTTTSTTKDNDTKINNNNNNEAAVQLQKQLAIYMNNSLSFGKNVKENQSVLFGKNMNVWNDKEYGTRQQKAREHLVKTCPEASILFKKVSKQFFSKLHAHDDDIDINTCAKKNLMNQEASKPLGVMQKARSSQKNLSVLKKFEEEFKKSNDNFLRKLEIIHGLVVHVFGKMIEKSMQF